MQENKEAISKPKKLFGVQNPILKSIMILTFIILTGGLGLIVLVLGYIGDRSISKNKGHIQNVVLVFFAASILVGCASNNVQIYASVDQNSKTVTVPAGSKGLKGDLKKGLSDHGWKMSVYSGPEVVEGYQGKNTKLQRYDTFNTRYSLFVESRQYDYCFTGSPAVNYELSLIDNKSGSEVVTMDGRNCQDDVVKQFTDALKGRKPN